MFLPGLMVSCARRDGIESDEGEEDHAAPPRTPPQPCLKMLSWAASWASTKDVVGGIDEMPADSDDDEDNSSP